MSSVTKITAKYQITLPGEVRRALKAKVGDLLVFVQQTDGSYRVQAVPAGGEPLVARGFSPGAPRV
jgi:AbrB family looped-hinge helix DNA binding protein